MTTFFAMVYILMVNANMFADPFGDGSNPLGVSYGAIYIATAISAVVGTILAGLISNLPLAQASGMGLNAFFVYTACIGFGLSYSNALVFCMVDMFDTLGTLYAACERADLLNENGDPINMNEGMLSDAFATTIGSLCGTSTVTAFSEVNAGVAAGDRTGLTSVFCGSFFFIAMFLSPIAQLIQAAQQPLRLSTLVSLCSFP